MTSATDALRAHRLADSEAKRRAVADTIQAAVEAPERLTVSAVAAKAGVSRQFIYSHPDLRAAVEAAARRPRRSIADAGVPTALEQGVRADRSVLTQKVEKQRSTIRDLRAQVAELEQQRSRWLGHQLEAENAVSPEEHTELRLSVQRLVSEKDQLARTVADLRRINATLELELAASRQAHTEDATRYGLSVGADVRALSAGARQS